MKFSWNWLKDYVDLDGVSPDDVAARLTMTVAELEGVEHLGAGLGDVRVALLAGVAPHPDADKLRVVTVDVGGRVVTGVSGAPNLRVGMKVPAALPGTVLPGDVAVRATTIRGVESGVVLLSEREMGLSDDHSGVMELPDDAPAGAALTDVLPVEDWVFEVDNKSITHRPDLWGHLGLAREVGAMTGRPMKPVADPMPACDADPLTVTVDDPKDCPRYMAACFGGIRVAPSPFWIRQRLRAVGLRPISNVVDLSNFVMMALGEPTHTFDRRFIGGDAIRVRRAAEGEAFRTLDGADHVLTAEDLLIADASHGIALAGVMGGENSEIRDDTTDVVLECATFQPGRVRRTAVRHGLRTDSSARFEKSLDPAVAEMAVRLFWRLLREVAPGAVATSRVYDVAGFDRTPLRVRLDPAFITRRLGMEVPASRTRAILENLGFGITVGFGGAFDVTVPSWRATRDVSSPEDLLEEIGRVIGYDQVPPTPPMAAVDLVPVRPLRAGIRTIKRVLAGDCGLDEVMSYSFDSQAMLARLGYAPDDPVAVANPISSDFRTLRTDLAPNLLAAVERNAQRFAEFGLFEVGRVFRGTHVEDGTPWQRYRVGIAMYRRAAKAGEDAEALLRRLRGAVEHLADRLDLAGTAMAEGWDGEALPWLAPRATLGLTASGRRLGWLTRVHPATLRALDVPGVAVMAELDVEELVAAPVRARRFAPVPRFPSSTIDLSLVAPEALRAEALFRAIREQGGPHLADVELFAIYRGAPIPEGRRSLSFRLTFQAPDRTLSDAEVKDAVARITEGGGGVGGVVGGRPRGTGGSGGAGRRQCRRTPGLRADCCGRPSLDCCGSTQPRGPRRLDAARCRRAAAARCRRRARAAGGSVLVARPADILFVSKPLSPPWDDSGKLLPYLVARHLDPAACRVEVPVPRGCPLDLPGVASWPVYSRDSSFAVPRGDKIRLLASLLARRLPPVVHFFFSPNAATSLAARAVRIRHPRTRFVQTVMSLPADDAALDGGLFADVVIAWSAVAAERIRARVAGRPRPPRVVHVPPGVVARDPLAPSRRDAVRGAFGLPVDRPVVLYAGDLEFSTAARTLAAAIPEVQARVDATFVFACRPKTPAAAAALADVRARLGGQEASGRVRFLGNVEDFHDLLGCVDLQVLPADTTYAKTDLPLVVLEGLLAGVPAVVGRGTPMDELVEAGAVLGVPHSDAGALATTIAETLSGPVLAALAGAGRAFALARHTAQAMACAHQALYMEMLRSE